MFERFNKFMNGEFTCIRCNRTWHSHGILGYGKMVCPECYTYKDLNKWLRPDYTYWLNRLFCGGHYQCKTIIKHAR